MIIKRFTPLFIVLLFFISCKKTETNNEPVKLFGKVFGTTYSIIYYGNGANYDDEIQQLFYDVNQSLSTYVPDSDISKINRGEEGIQIDEYFKEVYQKSSRIYKETEGYFDPTVGSLVNAWGFGPEKPLNNLDDEKVNELMELVGFNKVSVYEGEIIKQNPAIYFDFNAIAKGYGIDVVGRFLEKKEVENYLVEIGGEIRARGKKADGSVWRVQLDNPNTDGSRSAYDVLDVTDISLASSGNYRKFRVTEGGDKYVHTINPKTGYAKESTLLAATVMGQLDCADVDAYATAFMAMGLEKSKAFLLKKPELKVILVYAGENGELKEFRN